jgi:hypothetical protein
VEKEGMGRKGEERDKKKGRKKLKMDGGWERRRRKGEEIRRKTRKRRGWEGGKEEQREIGKWRKDCMRAPSANS